MGLEGIGCTEKMDDYSHDLGSDGMTDDSSCCSSLNSSASGSDSEMATDFDCSVPQNDVLLQAQALLKKSMLYHKIDAALRKANVFRPMVYNLPQRSDNDEDTVTSIHRDHAVSNLRFLNIFYGYNSASFALSVNLLDRLLGKVIAHPKYLSCIAISCYYIAIKTQEDDVFIPSATELVKLSQCGGCASDLLRMERLVLEKLQWELHAVMPLTFLQYFYEVLADKDPRIESLVVPNVLIAKLEVLMCQFEFTKYRAETLALALLSYVFQELGILNGVDIIAAIMELQYYCQISDMEFLQCRNMIKEYLALYRCQTTKVPRLKLQWTISRRTMNKLKPSTRCTLDLEPIMEDEVDKPDYGTTESDDTGPFDSETDENDNKRIPFDKSTTSFLVCPIHPEWTSSKRFPVRNCKMCPMVNSYPELTVTALHSKEGYDNN